MDKLSTCSNNAADDINSDEDKADIDNNNFADDTQAETKIEPKTKKKEKVVGAKFAPTTKSVKF